MSDATPFHLRGNYAPVTEECTASDLPVEGAIPPEITGSYVRNGPNPKTGSSPHWFSGDGMLHAVRLEGGRARSYRNRWVRTRSFLEEDAEMIGEDGSVDHTIAVANTNIVRHAGDWLALVESSFPTRVTPDLETLGCTDFAGRLRTSFTAHPKFCPLTGEMHFFGYGFFEPYLTYHRVNAAGELVQSEEIDVTGPTMVHDFAITDKHVIFFDLPVVFDLEAAMSGLEGEGEEDNEIETAGLPYSWSDDYPARIGVMERGVAGAKVRWSAVNPCYIFHPWNAFERDGKVVLDACRYDELWRGGSDNFNAAKPCRFEIDPAGGRVEQTQLFDREAEFPRINDRLCGLPHRFGYSISLGANVTEPSDECFILKHDFERGEESLWSPGAGGIPGEFVFVPANAQSGEDEGWLIGYVYDGNRDGSDLVILDATDLSSGPVARIGMPQRVPFGFHGNFFADE